MDHLLDIISVRKDLYPDKKRRATELLNEVQSHLDGIQEHVEEAHAILSSINKAIINNEGVHEIRLRQLDDEIEKASSKIKSGEEVLDEVERIINDLLFNGNVAKWKSRFIRFSIMGVGWFYFCKYYKATESRLAIKDVAQGAGMMVATYLLMSMNPENENRLLEEAKDIQSKHRKLYREIREHQASISRIRSWHSVPDNQN